MTSGWPCSEQIDAMFGTVFLRYARCKKADTFSNHNQLHNFDVLAFNWKKKLIVV